jgi:hypothetical protein
MEPSEATSAERMEPSGATTTEKPRRPRPPLRVETSQQPGETSWLDTGHAFIERHLFVPVLWVDRFFSDERDTEPRRSRSFIRLREEVYFAQFQHGPGFGFSFSASLKFDAIDKRLEKLSLEVTGAARDAFTALVQGDRTTQGDLIPPEERYGNAEAGLGFRLWETLHTHGDLGAGFLLKLPPGAYARARLRFVEPLGHAFLARQAVSGYWRTDTLFGTTATADLEHPIPGLVGALWRLTGTSTLTQRSRGLEWAGDLSLVATLFLRIGGVLGYGISGATAPSPPVGFDVHRVYLRLRRDVYRKWVFFEVAPEYQWPFMPDLGRRIGYWDVALRLEVQFQGRQYAPQDQSG